jgi:hypothetical protein
MAIPAGFANCPNFTWGASEGGGVFKFTAVYGGPWASAQLNDIVSFNGESTISIVGDYLQFTQTWGCTAGVHGVRFIQAMRVDQAVHNANFVSPGDMTTMGFCLTQLLESYAGISYNPNPGLVTANPTGTYEISLNGDTAASVTATTAPNTWYEYTATFSDSAVRIARTGLGNYYERTGTFSRDVTHYVGFGNYSLAQPTTSQIGQITITGAVTGDGPDTPTDPPYEIFRDQRNTLIRM